MYVIAGLGNPGKQYEFTRHNIGFDTLDFIATQYRLCFSINKYNGLIAEGRIQGEKVLLVKPQTYMNSSGECIERVINAYGLSVDKLIVIYDDMDIDIGKLRIRKKGGAGTHNGMKSIIYQLKDESFSRIRMGIGRPEQKWEIVDFVLSTFKDEQRIIINQTIEKASLATATIVKAGIELAMNKYNNT